MTESSESSELIKLKVMPTVVLYHANCVDGFGSAYVAWTALGDNATYLAVNYSQEPPYDLCENRDVLILDFYYKSTELILLANKAKSVTVLDHHKTSLHELQVAKHLASGDIEYVWANDLSGVGVTWNTFYPGMPMPKLLAHIQDRDLWKFELEGTKVINAALFNTAINPRTFAHWDKLIIIDPEYALVELADAGEILLSDLYARSNALIDNACEISIIYRNDDGALDDAKGIAINATSDYASELGNLALCDNLSDTYAAIWFYTGSEVQVSLRSKGDYDVSRIAKHHGGGGHKNAASFRVSLNELLIWLDQNPQ